MKLSEPESYRLTFTPERYTVECAKGKPRFSGIASGKTPKIYIASDEGRPIYVGQTISPMSMRMRTGWNANGKNGYHGYAWRRHLTSAQLDVWSHDDAPEGPLRHRDMETVEAEIVYLIRQRTDHWPRFQTEIHFYPSTPEHRRVAASILDHYPLIK